MARPRVDLDALQTQENKEEQPHTDPEKDNDLQSREEGPREVILCEAAGPSRLVVVTNPIIVEKIANFLSDKDLVSLCLASKTTKKIVDLMDSSCWRKRAQKLEAVLRLHTRATDSTPYKERYLLLIPEVERLATRIRGMIEDNFGDITVDPDDLDNSTMSLQDLAITASLVHHDMLGVSIKVLELWTGNISSIPPEHLGSLASCVTETVLIGSRAITSPNLGVLMDKVKSEMIEIGKCYETFGTDGILALVRAMQTRVKKVILYKTPLVVKTLLKTYCGRGRCEEVCLMVHDMESINTKERFTEEEMRQLALNINWDVDVKVDLEQLGPFVTQIIFKRK